jgi:hypothetical protein
LWLIILASGPAAGTASVKVRTAAGLNRIFPASDQLRALRPELAASMKVLYDRVFLTSIKQYASYRCVQTVLLDSLSTGSCRCFEEISFCVGDIVVIERGLGEDQIACINSLSRAGIFAE